MAKRPRSRLEGILFAIISLLVIIAGLFMSLSLLIHDEGFFRDAFEELRNAPQMGMSADDLTRATMRMIHYMDGSESSIDLMVTVNGEQTSMFNDRERAHMVDVRALYMGWRTAAILFVVMYALALVYTLLSSRARGVILAARAFLYGSGAILSIGLILGVWAAADFNGLWTAFHHVFFTNDLWLLNPATDRMIQMMPLGFFYRIVGSFALRFLIPWALLCAGAALLVGRDRRKRARGARLAISRAVERHIETQGRRKRD